MRDQILNISTEVESLLTQLGASGRGLHEKLSSIEGQISTPMVKKIRWIASVRNKAVHEHSFNIDIDEFRRGAAEALTYLRQLVAEVRDQQKRRSDQEKKVKPDKPWSEKSGWEKTVTVGTYVAAGGAFIAWVVSSVK